MVRITRDQRLQPAQQRLFHDSSLVDRYVGRQTRRGNIYEPLLASLSQLYTKLPIHPVIHQVIHPVTYAPCYPPSHTSTQTDTHPVTHRISEGDEIGEAAQGEVQRREEAPVLREARVGLHT